MKTVLITGGSTGLGYELAKRYARDGYHVVITGRNEEKLKASQAELKKQGAHVTTSAFDIQNEHDVKNAIDTLLQRHNIDVLINNAGVGHFGPLPSLSGQDIHNMIDTNVKGTIFVTQALIQHLCERSSAQIINIVSTAGLRGKVNETAYVASKFAVRGFTESLKAEYANQNVTIIGAYMGGMDTPFWDESDHIQDKSRLKPASQIADIVYDKSSQGEDIIL
ncbi:SDR family NAD(P)-dependent oxidoreductase [Metabacillus iocasae]|uniref:Short-subunit dehydrogenase n=1 Tax=Priestia iocasae TaxID=2291674 RepID=A0ABS2QYV2_9BACI|nr:SDR family oxidoreductase [Metabacillus iocasae]MBM7704423.1 short-subunit dehydrogenase [Metabacillus iocasae]